MLDRDVLILQALGRVLGINEKPLQTLRDVDLAGLDALARDARDTLQLLLEPLTKRAEGHLHLLEDATGETLFLIQKRRE